MAEDFADIDSAIAILGETNLSFIIKLTRYQVEILLKPYQIELLEEEEHSGQTPLDEARDWHIFHIVAKKNE